VLDGRERVTLSDLRWLEHMLWSDPEERPKVARALSELATGLGAVTPGGPFAAFPIVYALFLAGADIGAVVAYLTGWSVLALHRVIIWELPLLGPEFAIVRLLASLPLPILAGAIARLLADRFFHVPTPLPKTKSGGGGP